MSTGMGLFLIVLLVFGVLVGGTTMINERTRDLEDTQDKLQSCQSSEQSLHAENAQVAKDYEQLEQDYTSISIDNAQCRAENEALKAAITEASAEGEDLKKEIEQCKVVNKELMDKNSGYETVLAESAKLLHECDDRLANLQNLPQSCLLSPGNSFVNPSPVLANPKSILPDFINERWIAILAMVILGLMSLMNLAVAYQDRNQVQPNPQTTKVNANPNKVTITMDRNTYQDFIRYMRNK
jgi:hypothetical protein